MHRLAITFVCAALVMGAGCEDAASLGSGEDYELMLDLVPDPITKVDVLLVVDNSNSMQDEQASLGENLGEHFFQAMDLTGNGPIDWHVAVVSTDVGTGAGSQTGCSSTGDDGAFQVPQGASGACLPVGESYLIDEAADDGTRSRNFSGDRAQVFDCTMQLGTGGCGFEQPLASMKRALERSQTEGDGFLREDAMLAVVIVSDEDDCSVFDDAMFAGQQTDPIDSELGALSSFRCFEFGVVCNEDDDPRLPGARSGCQPRDDSAYVEQVQSYVDYLDTLRPGSVFVATITGGAGPVDVAVGGPEGDIPNLKPSCTSESGSAAPAVRLTAFADSFPLRNQQTSICAGDLGPALDDIAGSFGEITGGGNSACLQGAVADVSDDDGVQPRCRALATPHQGHEEQSEIPLCTSARTTGCVTVSASDACGGEASGFEAVLHGDVVPEGWHLLVECES